MRRYKRPSKHSRFAWACIPGEHGLHYRLSRRDLNGRLHFSMHTFEHGTSMEMMVKTLKAMRHSLLQHVDAIDLRLLGVISSGSSESHQAVHSL